MGKDNLANRRDLWATHQLPLQATIDRPDHPRPAEYPQLSAPQPALRRRATGPRPLSFTMFRLISPALIPLALGGASFAVLALLTIGAPDLVPVSMPPEMLGPLFFIFAAIAVILAAALAYAPNDTIWALVMIAGLLAYGTITTGAVFGLPAAAALIIALGSLLAVIVRSQIHTVLENTVHVMVLFGKYNRTLRPGFNLRLPGEQLWAIVHTNALTIEVTAHDIILPKGPAIDATAIASCFVAPERAYLVADHAGDWPERVQRCFELALSEALSESEADEVFGGVIDDADPLFDTSLATRVRGHLLHLVGRWGVNVEWLRIAAVHPSKAVASLPVREATGIGPAVAATPLALPREVAPPPRPPIVPVPDVVSSQPDPTDMTHMRGVTPGAFLPLPPAMQRGVPVPEALIAAYDAVRACRITDPHTIMRIAQAFETVATDPVLGPHLPFDAREAARNLRVLAANHAAV